MLKQISTNILFKKKPLLDIRNEVKKFEDNNFILFELNESHYKLLKLLYTDTCVKKMLTHEIHTNTELIQTQLNHFIDQHYLNKLGVYVIYDKQIQKRIGLLEFNFKGKTNTVIDLSIILRAPFRRRGLGSKVCAVACTLALQHKLNYLNAIILSENIVAQKTLIKNGFLPTGPINHYLSKNNLVLTFFKDLTTM